MTDQSLALSGHKAKGLLIAGLIVAGTFLPSATLAEDAGEDNYSEWGDCEAQGLITAEDYSCVPPSFYEGAGDAPSPSSPEARVGVAINKLVACGQADFAMRINDAYSWTANDPEGASEDALVLLTLGAERVAERGC